MRPSISWIALGALFGAIGLALAACDSSPAGSQSVVGLRLPGISDRPLANDFTLSTGHDSSFSLSEHRGSIVVLYFSFPG